MEFFTSPQDLKGWVKSQGSADEAAKKIMEIIGQGEEQDVVDTCQSIFNTEDNHASEVLFEVLARHKLTQIKEGAMKDNKIKRQAQGIYRGEAALYQDMGLRVCPKLPRSVGRVVNKIHCRDYIFINIYNLEDGRQRRNKKNDYGNV